MSASIGIRREDKNEWERRTPLIPKHIKELKEKHSIDVYVQPSAMRIFPDEEYKKAGAIVEENMGNIPIIFGVKEIPLNFFKPNTTYVFFSHTIKGQAQNMPMLQRMRELHCTLIDYEKIVNKNGKRLIFFGRFAGHAGIINTLWAFGKKCEYENIKNPFPFLKRAIQYTRFRHAKRRILKCAKLIKEKGLPPQIAPLIIGITGYGHVSRGVQEILHLFPIKEIRPEKIPETARRKGEAIYKNIFMVIFEEKDMYEPVSPNFRFELQDYYENPQKYKSKFPSYVPYLSIIANCIYWEKKYPKLVTKDFLKLLFSEKEKPLLRVIGDISCDIEGSMECTVKTTNSGNPVFLYDPITQNAKDGFEGRGIVVMAIDNLPCEFALESSRYFSKMLKKYVIEIARANYSLPFEELNLSPVIKNAIILYNGEFTPNFKYMEKFL